MNKKIFLTSAVIMCMACPAFAETFPQDGNMLENKTYDNAATYANTGIYEGDVTADAYYSTNNYNVSAGSYFTGLDANNDATTAQCTSGNYCPGVQSTTYDAENSAFVDDGLQTCPNGYASSDLGASANTQCYRTCDIANMGANGTIATIAHAASLSGHDYYGNGTDTCEPATCVAGWHKKDAVPDLNTVIGTDAAENSACVNNSGTYRDGDSGKDISYFGLSTEDHNSFATDYGTRGMIYGHGRCSTQQGYKDTVNNNDNTYNNPTTFASLTDEAGQEGAVYCYCKLDGYTPNGGTLQSVSTPWVFLFNMTHTGGVSGCANMCASYCSLNGISSGWYSGIRPYLFGLVTPSPASCEANTINITWNDASAEDIAATGAATTVYEGDIKTPLKAVTKPGKTFVGWKFIKPTTPVQQ